MRAFRFLWLALAIVIGALGIAAAFLSMPFAALLATGTVGGLLGCAAHQLISRSDGPSFGLPSGLATTVAMAVTAGVVTAGVTSLLGASGGVLVVLLIASWPTAYWYAERTRVRRRAGGPGRTENPPSVTRATAAVPIPVEPHPGSLSDEELCLAWRTSYTALLATQNPAERARLADVRAGYLDELERRDQLGFARWMASGARAASDPGRYLTTPGHNQSRRLGSS